MEIGACAVDHWAPEDPQELTAEHWTKPSRTLFLQAPRPGQVEAAAHRLERCLRLECMCARAYVAPAKLAQGLT